MPLPTLGQAIERPVMDWKVKSAKHSFERAKDVAAFANHLGGTLLIGAQEVDGQLQAYVGMTPAEAGVVRDEYSKAVADRCTPRPAIDFEEYDAPGDPAKKIVAINVQPSLNLVGVKVRADKTQEGHGGDAYIFPVRSGTDARFLDPGELAMFMTPKVRRIAVLLSRIPKQTIVNLMRPVHRPSNDVRMRFVEVREEDNLVLLSSLSTPDYAPPERYPLDRFTTVFEDTAGWRLHLELWDTSPPD